MPKQAILLSLLFLFANTVLKAQDEPKDIMSVTAGLGVITFKGDVGSGKEVSKYTYIRGGYAFALEKRFANNWIGASLNVMTGKLAMGERSRDVTRNRNFESSITQFGLNISGYLQNKKGIPLVPYVTAGFSFAQLKAFTDLKYNGDSLYYYWDDGSIRNLPHLPINELTAKHVKRDYIYESPLDSAATSAMAVPIGLGVKMRIGKKAEANIGAAYHVTFADDIDAFKIIAGNDSYLYSYFSLTYNITKKSKEAKVKEAKATVDFASIDKLDMDADGVNDNTDICPGTPKGAKVDAKGCPLDSDADGVPDYSDKEANTKKGSIVDEEGKTVTDAMILEKANRDSLASSRTSFFMAAPSASSLKKIDTEIQSKAQTTGGTTSKLPEKFQSADLNKDGVISSIEITAMIDGFFDGSNNYTVEKINELIDFFFEQ